MFVVGSCLWLICFCSLVAVCCRLRCVFVYSLFGYGLLLLLMLLIANSCLM